MTERKQTEISQKYFGILLLSVPQFPRNHSCLNNSGTPQLFFAALRRQTIPAQKTHACAVACCLSRVLVLFISCVFVVLFIFYFFSFIVRFLRLCACILFFFFIFFVFCFFVFFSFGIFSFITFFHTHSISYLELTPFQNPATARTADSRERTGAAKAPVCSPAILSIDRFALDSGGKRVPTAANDLRHTVPARVASLLWRAMDTTSAPFTPHSGPHGQTEECCLRSVLLPLRPRKVGPGFRMELPRL